MSHIQFNQKLYIGGAIAIENRSRTFWCNSLQDYKMYPIIAGFIVAFITIIGIQMSGNSNKPWAYPLTLSLYPLFYIGFAIYAGDYQALLYEAVFALPFFMLCGLIALRSFRYSGYLLGGGLYSHGVYDAVHHHIFINNGAPHWWPEFCGVIDVIIGVYLLYFSSRLPGGKILVHTNR